MDDLVDRSLERAIVQSKLMASDLISKPGLLPRTIDKEGKLETSTSRWWCSGFFPGVLWYLYEVSSDDSLKNYAQEFTKRIEREQYTTTNHDVGFMLYCSFGNGLRLTKDESYKKVLLQGSKSLSTRYRPMVGCIRSWDWNKKVWQYVNQFAEFNRFTNSPVANYKGELYSLPFNMYTFNKMWGVVTPEEATKKIEEQRKEITHEPTNLEEQAISLVGRDIYEKLIKGYTEKQWGRDCKDLPSFIIKRLPVRLTFDNNYFNALYQGIPVGGYTKMVENMLEGIEVRLNTDYLENKEELDQLADKVVYTGPIDAYFNYQLGTLEYRSVRFETELLDIPNFQGNAAVNYTDRETPWTRIIEHKWFEFGKDKDGNDIDKTVISREYSSEWKPGDEPYYPVNDERNNKLYAKYKELADQNEKVIFGGRLGMYKYFDMDAVIAEALNCVKENLGEQYDRDK